MGGSRRCIKARRMLQCNINFEPPPCSRLERAATRASTNAASRNAAPSPREHSG
jgi:hypothetical protein